jgi:hypothetical protein
MRVEVQLMRGRFPFPFCPLRNMHGWSVPCVSIQLTFSQHACFCDILRAYRGTRLELRFSYSPIIIP